MSKCFVIQPFDKGKFDSRYADIFQPSINNAGLEAYRVDKDYGVVVPIEEIESGIRQSSLCFAEITTNNPNVWYELGFAFACGKEVVMVCEEERGSEFPFDIRHKKILTYKTGSPSDFKKLEHDLTETIKAYLSRIDKLEKLSFNPIKEVEGLQPHEISMMLIIMENQLTSEDSIYVYQLKEYMNRAGYTDIAASVTVRSLSRKGLIESKIIPDQFNNDITCIRLTSKGEDWVLNNQERITFRSSERNDSSLPF